MPFIHNIHIKSEHLQLVESFMEKYFDFHPTMLHDEIRQCVVNSGINYKKIVDDVFYIDYEETFSEHKELTFIAKCLYNKNFCEVFANYFTISNEDEIITEDDIVSKCLIYMIYIYYKEHKGLFNNSCLIADLDIEYLHSLHDRIYPEIASLYKMILESKTKKNRGSKITITYKQNKIDINSCAWFLDDMEKYFKDRFPDLTLEEINQMLSDKKGKTGRKFNNRITNNLIWGTYQLLRNHHSKFKNSKTRISEEICQFIIDYLDFLEIQNDFILVDIRNWLKDMIKRGYTFVQYFIGRANNTRFDYED